MFSQGDALWGCLGSSVEGEEEEEEREALMGGEDGGIYSLRGCAEGRLLTLPGNVG